MKKKIIIIVSILVLVGIGILLIFNYNKPVKEDKNKIMFYHCESSYLTDKDIDYYKYTLNYDFEYKDLKLLTSSYYIKAVFNNKEKYDNFKVQFSTDDNDKKDYKSDKDDKNLIRYYSISNIIESNNSSIDKYLKDVEEKLNLKCKKTEKDNLKNFK